MLIQLIQLHLDTDVDTHASTYLNTYEDTYVDTHVYTHVTRHVYTHANPCVCAHVPPHMSAHTPIHYHTGDTDRIELRPKCCTMCCSVQNLRESAATARLLLLLSGYGCHSDLSHCMSTICLLQV